MRPAGAALIAAVLLAASCGDDDSPVTVGTDVGEVTVTVRSDQVCLDGESKGGFCGGRPSDDHPVTWGSAGGGAPEGRTYVWGVTTPEVTALDVVVGGADSVSPDLHEIDGGELDGLNVWAVEVHRPGDPMADDSKITVENIEMA